METKPKSYVGIALEPWDKYDLIGVSIGVLIALPFVYLAKSMVPTSGLPTVQATALMLALAFVIFSGWKVTRWWVWRSGE